LEETESFVLSRAIHFRGARLKEVSRQFPGILLCRGAFPNRLLVIDSAQHRLLEFGELSGLWPETQGINKKSEQTVLLRMTLAITSQSTAKIRSPYQVTFGWHNGK
jgi:hypothetical protein